MKTGYIEHEVTTDGVVSIDIGDAVVIGSDCGIYNIIAKKASDWK